MSDTQAPVDRKRSPRHPSFDLALALDRARAIHKESPRGTIPQAAIAGLWGVSDASSGFRQAVATLKQFGLIEAVETGGTTHVKLTELARNVFLYSSPEHAAEQRAAIQQAARSPQMHAKLLEHYHDELPASDATLKVQLVKQFQFHEDAVDDFIDELRSTLAFAGVTGRIAEAPATAPKPAEVPTMLAAAASAAPIAPAPTSIALGTSGPTVVVTQPFTLPLGGGAMAVLHAPPSMTRAQWDKMMNVLRALEGGLVDE